MGTVVLLCLLPSAVVAVVAALRCRRRHLPEPPTQ